MMRFGGISAGCALLAALLLGGCGTGDEGSSSTRAAETAGAPGEAWYDTYPAVTVTLVQDADPAALVSTMYGQDATPLATPTPTSTGSAGSTGEDDGWVAAGKVGDWAFVWENDGWQGSDLAKAAALSRRSMLVSAFWNAHDLALATVANRGRVTRQFDPVSRTDPAGAVGAPLADERWLDWDHDWKGAALRLQARLAGLRGIADPSWLHRPGVRFWAVPDQP